MKVSELIKALETLPQDHDVVVNAGPCDQPCIVRTVTKEWTDEEYVLWADGNDPDDKPVVVIG